MQVPEKQERCGQCEWFDHEQIDPNKKCFYGVPCHKYKIACCEFQFRRDFKFLEGHIKDHPDYVDTEEAEG